MQDLISRQAAIDAIRKIYDSVGILGEKWAVDKCQMAIKDLPSAQPEPIKINIENFNKEDWERLKKEWGNTPITVLPAQHEIIRCKDCKYYRWEIDMCNEMHSTAHNIVHEDDYCSRAERKEE